MRKEPAPGVHIHMISSKFQTGNLSILLQKWWQYEVWLHMPASHRGLALPVLILETLLPAAHNCWFLADFGYNIPWFLGVKAPQELASVKKKIKIKIDWKFWNSLGLLLLVLDDLQCCSILTDTFRFYEIRAAKCCATSCPVGLEIISGILKANPSVFAVNRI